MVYRWIRYGLLVFGILAFSNAWMPPAYALDRGDIVGVRIAPDLRRIIIQSDGPLGEHKAFVIGQPYRLVIDFQDVRLSRGLSRIKVGKKPIREIRLGSTASRTRVVVDFGLNPAPPYKIHQKSEGLVVSLGESLPAPPRPSGVSRKANTQEPPPKPRPKHARSPKQKQKAPHLKIKSAEVIDGLVVVELADTKNPQKSCKLILEVDLDRMKLNRAALNDGKGKIVCSDDNKTQAPGKPADSESIEPVRGPRRDALHKKPPLPKKSQFKWGLPKVESRGPTKATKRKIGPLRVEDFALTRTAVAEHHR